MRVPVAPTARHLVALVVLLAAVLSAAAANARAEDPYAPQPAPAPAPAPAPTPAPDEAGPRLTKVTLAPKVARPGSRLTLGFKLDEEARVAGEVTKRTTGVRTKGGRCVKRTRTRRGPDCTRRTRAGTLLAARAAAGENRGMLDLGALGVGDYTLTLTPTDTAGNVGAVKLIAFRVRIHR